MEKHIPHTIIYDTDHFGSTDTATAYSILLHNCWITNIAQQLVKVNTRQDMKQLAILILPT